MERVSIREGIIVEFFIDYESNDPALHFFPIKGEILDR